ncbi:MAG: hypothetical protein EA414_02365 [Arthrospira sp. PLM2.Bin9]|nr:MAG: hypothetical protein EA414_02365 [Arthrospira sp. PLM2.Bin9]
MLRNVAKNFFGVGGLLLALTSGIILDNGNLDNFIFLTNFLLCKSMSIFYISFRGLSTPL